MKAKQLHNETLSKIKGGHIGMTNLNKYNKRRCNEIIEIDILINA